MYSVRFVPIVEKENEVFDHNEEILERRSQNSELVHVLRTTRFCWCDLDALATLNRGIMYPFYVIEVEVEGWNGNDTRNKDLLSHVSILYYLMYHILLSLKRSFGYNCNAFYFCLQPSKRDIYPIFTAEDGNVYIRRNATTEFMSRESVIKHAENMRLLD